MDFDFNPLLWFVCKLCRKTFPDTDRLKAHKLENHLEDCLKIKCIIFEEKLLEHEWSPPDSNQYNHHHSSQSNSYHNSQVVDLNSNQSYYETLPVKLNQNFNANVNLTRNYSPSHDGQERNFENPYVVQIPPAQSQPTSQSQLNPNPKYSHSSTNHSRFASHLQRSSGFSRRKRQRVFSSAASSYFQDEYQPSSHKQSKIENILNSSSAYHPNSAYNNFNNNANQELPISERGRDRDRNRRRYRYRHQKEQYPAHNTAHIDASTSSSGSSSDSDTATRIRNKNNFMSMLSTTPKSKSKPSSSVQKFDFEFPKSLQVIEVIKPKMGSSAKSYPRNLTDSPARLHPISGPRKDIDTRIRTSSASAPSSYFQSHLQKQRTNPNLNNNNNIVNKDNYNNYQMQNPAAAAANYNARDGGSVKVEFIEYTDGDADAADFFPTSFLQQSLTLPTSQQHNVSTFSPSMTIIPTTSMSGHGSGPGPVQGSSFTSKIKNQATLKPTFMCNFCALSFPKKNLLLNHLKEHDIERPFQCPDCPSSFKDSGTLRRHQIVHGRVTRHKCSFCGKSFNFRNVLEDHVRTHTGDRPFKCQVDGCEYAFSSKTALNMHTRRKHSEELGLEQFDCVVCSRTFGLQSELHKHIQVNHREDKPFKCPQSTCRKSYQSKRQLLKHIVGHTMASNMPMTMSIKTGLQQQQQGVPEPSSPVPASSAAMSIPDIDQDPESSSLSSSAELDLEPEPDPDQLQLTESISISMLSQKPKSLSDPELDTPLEESTIVINESIFENY